MIERMKKLTLLAVASERKALLKDLMLLGCVELKEQAATDEAPPALREMGQTGLATEKARHAAITNALKLLDKYAPAKKSFLAPLPGAGIDEVLDESTLDADVELCEHIAELEERIRRATAEEGREKAAIEALSPWAELDMPLSFRGTERAAVTLCSLGLAILCLQNKCLIGGLRHIKTVIHSRSGAKPSCLLLFGTVLLRVFLRILFLFRIVLRCLSRTLCVACMVAGRIPLSIRPAARSIRLLPNRSSYRLHAPHTDRRFHLLLFCLFGLPASFLSRIFNCSRFLI